MFYFYSGIHPLFSVWVRKFIKDILNFDDSKQHYLISQCHETKGCKTYEFFITDAQFTSNLTKNTYFTRSYDDLNCKSVNVVYGLECNLSGLVYVGETKGRLNKRMCGHKSDNNLNANDILYKHFNQPYHSIVSMTVRIIENMYHKTKNPQHATPLRRQKEDYWIQQSGTVAPY